ncbi:MAG: diguanylate cyclase [Gammaproteobacteria bacterium]|nr:diguanylate cyclase [Gammaproteobacteria bacterium]
MPGNQFDIQEIHWQVGMIQNIDVGLLVLDRDYNIQIWNGFMQNHSGIHPSDAMQKNIFDLFKDLPVDWFKRKVESVFMLNTRSFIVWEQRPYLFKFKNYLPITGLAEFMYQNITMIPLVATDNQVSHVGIMIYDVTDIAINKHQLEEANSTLETLSRTDRLTQLYNRGFWEESLAQEFQRNQRTHEPCSLVMFDIDHFKKVNDTYGHQAGDEVIRQTASMLTHCKRTTDIAGRYGGEEFTVLLIGTSAENAMIFAERMRKKIEALTVKHDGEEIKFTISLGISEMGKNINNHKDWIEHSDLALYAAKHGGRNQTVIYSDKLQSGDK